MDITVEDGTIVPGANSYITLEELQEYAEDRAITLPEEEDKQKVLLVKAMDYLALYEERYRGNRKSETQPQPYPRDYADGIPKALKTAQKILAVAAMTIDLFPAFAATAQRASLKKVGPITVQYQASSATGYGSANIPQLMPYLNSLLRGGAGQVPVVRA